MKIDDYGSNESENISSYTDASQVDGEGQTLGQLFGTKVKLDVGKRKGKIVIEYTNNDDLERILELIK